MATLRLRLEGDEGPIRFESLVHAMERSLHLLRDVDRTITAQTNGAVAWFLSDLMMNSPSPVAVLRGAPRTVHTDDRAIEQVGAGFVRALSTAEQGDALPPFLSEIGLGHLRALAGELGTDGVGAFHATYVEQELEARVSHEAGENVRRLIVPKSKAIGSIVGRLEVVSVHEGYRYNVYDQITKRAVRCYFAPEELETVKEALTRRVRVAGIIQRNTRGQPLRIDQPRLTVLPSEGGPEVIDRVMGIDPDFTGDLSTDEYVRRLRDG